MSDHMTLTDGQARELARKLQEQHFGEPVRRFVATGEIADGLREALAKKQAEASYPDGDDEAIERIEALSRYVEAVGFRPPVTKWATRP
jgi:hypothetical protein